ncbi:MAG TPA: ABC transporter ATP-binding protein [Candidatus Methylomirabilis sp.]|nr:ABC transporter ATP-binding protein [Candidatus Methylomirabilis sp.]
MRPAGDLRRFLRLLGRYLVPHWRAVVLLVALSYAATALAGLLPILMAPILDLAIGSPAPAGAARVPLTGLSLNNLGAAFFQWLGVSTVHDRFRAILFLCLAYVGVGIVKGWTEFANYLLALWIRVRVAAAMQMDVFRHLLGLSMRFFTGQRSGELVSRLSTDTSAAAAGLETIVGTALSAPLLVAFYGYLLVRTSPRLVVAGLGTIALHYAVTRFLRGPVRRLATDQFSAFADLAARFQEAVSSIRVVKSLGAERFEAERVGRAVREVLRVNVKFGFYKHVEEPGRAVVNHVVEASVLLLAAWELLAGRMGAPAFFLFLYVGRALMLQVGALGAAYTRMQTTLAAATRLSELMALAPEVQDGPESISQFSDRIRVEDVSFDYGGERVLDRVSVEIGKGEFVALVGPSGAGKSTLADLLLRLYDPVEGRITIDGRDIRTLGQAGYRRLFGVVSQDALLFNATVRENIAYGRDGLTEADIVRAAGIANAHGFITEFPDGYDTLVGDRGVRLSGGQRQRVAIARAVVARPSVLILDEATSSLDSESERLVQQAIEQATRGTTTIAIAHRLSTVLHADKIIVLGRGGVEAVGRHVDLLAASETYGRLYRLQFSEAESLGRL